MHTGALNLQNKNGFYFAFLVVPGLALVGLVDGARHVHVCAGYTGHGMGFAVNAASALVRRMLDGEPLPGWLDAQRFGSGLNLTTTTP